MRNTYQMGETKFTPELIEAGFARFEEVARRDAAAAGIDRDPPAVMEDMRVLATDVEREYVDPDRFLAVLREPFVSGVVTFRSSTGNRLYVWMFETGPRLVVDHPSEGSIERLAAPFITERDRQAEARERERKEQESAARKAAADALAAREAMDTPMTDPETYYPTGRERFIAGLKGFSHNPLAVGVTSAIITVLLTAPVSILVYAATVGANR